MGLVKRALLWVAAIGVVMSMVGLVLFVAGATAASESLLFVGILVLVPALLAFALLTVVQTVHHRASGRLGGWGGRTRQAIVKAARVGFYVLVVVACVAVLWQQGRIAALEREVTRLTQEVSEAVSAAHGAQWAAEDAQSAAGEAQSAAEGARSAAEDARSAAEDVEHLLRYRW